RARTCEQRFAIGKSREAVITDHRAAVHEYRVGVGSPGGIDKARNWIGRRTRMRCIEIKNGNVGKLPRLKRADLAVEPHRTGGIDGGPPPARSRPACRIR